MDSPPLKSILDIDRHRVVRFYSDNIYGTVCFIFIEVTKYAQNWVFGSFICFTSCVSAGIWVSE